MKASKVLAAALALLFLSAMASAFAGCTDVKADKSDFEDRLEQMLGFVAEEDEDGAYSMLFPGTVSREAFHENFAAIREAYSVPAEHTLELTSYKASKGIGIGYTLTATGDYVIRSGRIQLRVKAEWKEKDGEQGFTSFCVINETDLAYSDGER